MVVVVPPRVRPAVVEAVVAAPNAGVSPKLKPVEAVLAAAAPPRVRPLAEVVVADENGRGSGKQKSHTKVTTKSVVHGN